jgi:Tfp pilus assembly protein PilO
MRRAALLGVLAVVALAGGWYRLVWQPQGEHLAAAVDRQHAAEDAQTDALASVKRLAKRKGQEAEVHQALDQLKAAVPDDADLSSALAYTAASAAVAGVELQSVAPSPVATKGSGPAATRLALTVAGPYPNVASFIDHLGTVPRLVVVDGVTMAADKDGHLTAQVDARAFSVKPAQITAPKVAATTTTTTAKGK